MRVQTVRLGLMSGAAIAAATVLAPVASAQSAGTAAEAEAAPASGFGDIIVTAQRREERLQDVPIAISAFNSEDLEARQVNNTLDLVAYVPNLIGHNNTALGTANAYSLRGLANTESIATFDPPVGTYVDDIYISRQGANNFSFFDVERIEVLRGPQGTLFGRNTTGGAINVIMRKPGDVITGYVDAGYGRYNKVQLRGSVDLPLSPKVLTKLSAFHVSSDGYVTNRTTGEKLNGENSVGLRGAVRAFLGEAVTWDVSADYIRASASNLPNFYDPKTDERINFTPLRTDTPIGSALVSRRLADNKLGNTAESYAVTSNLEFAGDDFTVNLITGYRDLYQEYVTESFAGLNSATLVLDGIDFVSASRGTATPLVNDSWHKQFSAELKLTGSALDGRFDYVAGLYYIKEDNETDFANISLLLSGAALVSGDRVVFNDTEAYAGYAQGDFAVTDALTLTAGLRYTIEDKNIRYRPNPNPLPRSAPANQPFDTAAVIAAGIPVELKARELTPRFAAEFQFNPDVMVFASATRGFKSGGWNARAFNAALADEFTQETLWSYEAGLRSELFDNRLRVNLTGFYYIDKDTQLPGGGLNPLTGTIIYLTRNVADQKNYGLEAEISARPLDGLNLYWNFGLQRASYQNLNQITRDQRARCLAGIIANNCNAGIITPTGGIGEPTRAPEFTSTVGFSYRAPLSERLVVMPALNWNYVSGTWVSTSNDPRGFQPGHSIVNGGITFKYDDRFSIGVECSNCLDDTYRTSFLIYPYLNAPGSWLVRTRYEF